MLPAKMSEVSLQTDCDILKGGLTVHLCCFTIILGLPNPTSSAVHWQICIGMTNMSVEHALYT